MTDREKAIVMAHTGICMLEGEKLGVFYQYLEELYGRPVYTHELVMLDIKEKSKPDFLKMCIEEEIPPMPRSEKHTETHGNACVRLIKLQDAIDTVNSIDNLDVKARGGIVINLVGLPSAESEMVKCKQCRYVYYDKEFDNYWCNRMSDPFKVEADGYCKWGE